MSIRRLHPEQPDSFAFTPANLAWAEEQIAKYPEGRQMSAVIPLLWRAQEQEGWVTRPMIHAVATMLAMDPIRVLEVVSFYYMFHMQPVGSVAHVQICGTTSCMICGAEDLMAVCREKIAPEPYELSADGKFSWDEVECIGACSNAPVVQIGKDYYEDLTAENFAALLDALARGEVPRPGPQNGRWASEPLGGRTSLAGDPVMEANASVELALTKGDTLPHLAGRSDGGDMQPRAPRAAAERPGEPAGHAAPDAAPHTHPDRKERAERPAPLPSDNAEVANEPAKEEAAERQTKDAPAHGNNGSTLPPRDGHETAEGKADEVMPSPEGHPHGATPGETPELMPAPRDGKADDLKQITGIGPKLEELLNGLGIWHFDQIAGWGAGEIAWIDDQLAGFRGRVERDDWVGQAKALSQGGSAGSGKREN